MTDFIGIDIAGQKELQKKLDQLPGEAQDEGVESANSYLVNVVKAYPPYAYVSRRSAYPDAPYKPGWFSLKQLRYVMAKIASGEIQPPYLRTQSLRNAWKKLGYGVKQIIVNENPAAVYAHDDQRQARQLGRVGWKKIGDILKGRRDRIVDKFDEGVRKAIKRLGLD